jgi:transposase
VAELPEVLAEVTEHRGHARTCAGCGKITRAEIPAEIRAHCAGPNLTATLSFMSGCLHASKRAIEETCETLFGVPLSLGTISKLEAETSAALETPHAEALEAVRAAPVKNVDETGWAKHGWLWLAATASIAVFAIHAKRGKAGFQNLLGQVVTGIVCSDRWGVYALVDVLRRQLCWAHLKREWKEKKIERSELQARLAPACLALYRALQRGRDGPDKKVRRFCKRLLKDYEAMWLFADVDGVEPTNNHAERCLRPAVMWRKRSFGNHSEAGCRFTERLRTAVKTLKLQKRPVLEYLKSAVFNHRAGRPVPSLLAA